MDRYDLYNMNSKREEALWRDAIIIFDTSSIGSMYYLVENDRKALCDILGYLKDKIVIPAQVMYEYKKNRNKFIQNPIVESYATPKWYMDTSFSDNVRNFFNEYKLSPKFSHEDNNPDKLKDLLVNVFGVADTAVIDEGVEMIFARNKYVHQYNVDGTSYEYIYSGKNGYLRLVKCIESISSYF